MAQGLDTRSLNSAEKPPIDSKNYSGDSLKKTRGVGSRRIFSPQFKLRVLDSYRNDIDCRGNQRATARKYNIHRRQIQKWLQCEHNLRSTVKECAKNEIAGVVVSNSRKKSDSEEGKTELTLNQSATSFPRLTDSGRLEENITQSVFKEVDKVCAVSESKTNIQNLKRIAQKLYPSLQSNPRKSEERVEADVGEQKCRNTNVICALGLSSNSAAKQDDNKKVTREDDGPLNLKNEVRSEILPEEFHKSDADVLPETKPDKLNIRENDNCQFGLTSSENIGGPKLSASNAVLKCRVQKYNMGDIVEQELYVGDSEKKILLCSQSVNTTEPSSLLDISVPINFKSVSFSLGSGIKRKLDGKEKNESSNLDISTDSFCSEKCPKIPKIENQIQSKVLNLFDCTKSFSPKRKWMKESMREMQDDTEHIQEASSLPIKQRVKMNFRSLPESVFTSDNCNRSNGIPSDFTIEKLCSRDSVKSVEASDYYECHDSCKLASPDTQIEFPTPLVLPKRIIPDLVSLHLKPEICHRDNDLEMKSCGQSDYSLGVPLKEEISDGEDLDVDILSTTPVENKSFDFSGYNFGKRRSFSVQFKLTVLDAFYNDKDCNKNQRATARKFNINRRQVQKWLSQESDLRSESSFKNGKYLQRHRLGSDGREGCAKCPQHCFRKKANMDGFHRTIQVNVKHCSDKECLSRRASFDSDAGKSKMPNGLDFISKPLFSDDMHPGNLYHNYMYPENFVYNDTFLGWSHLNSSALAVPNYQCLSSWHHNFDFRYENSKIY